MTWGGWLSEAMLARYAHLRPRDIEHWVDRIAPPGKPLEIPSQGSSGRGTVEPMTGRSLLSLLLPTVLACARTTGTPPPQEPTTQAAPPDVEGG